jgi:transcriptional regulator with XRE-family HTH domain
MRAIRGARSQVAFARRLGYRSNPVTDWEHGRRYPTAQECLRACTRVGIDVEAAFARFQPAEPLRRDDSGGHDLASWLDAIRGSLSLNALAERADASRFALGRTMKGQASPRLPEFLRIVDAITARAPELVAELVPIDEVPAFRDRYESVAASKRIAYEAPWTEAILRILETREYREQTAHDDAFIAERLRVSEDEVRRGIALLRRARVVHRRKRRYEVSAELHVEAARDPEALGALRAHWGRVIAERARDVRAQDAFGYNVLTVGANDVDAVRDILRRAYREIRARVADAQDPEVAAFVGLQMFLFDE